jgi:AraC family transcriptional regulator
MIEIEDFPGANLLAVRHHGPFHEIGPKFAKAFEAAQQMAAPIQGSMGVYYGDPMNDEPSTLRSDACVIVPGSFETPKAAEVADGTLHGYQIPACKVAKFRYIGPYDGLGHAWGTFMQEFASNGYEFADGPAFEIYVSDMDTTPPEELITDLYQPVK